MSEIPHIPSQVTTDPEGVSICCSCGEPAIEKIENHRRIIRHVSRATAIAHRDHLRRKEAVRKEEEQAKANEKSSLMKAPLFAVRPPIARKKQEATRRVN